MIRFSSVRPFLYYLIICTPVDVAEILTSDDPRVTLVWRTVVFHAEIPHGSSGGKKKSIDGFYMP